MTDQAISHGVVRKLWIADKEALIAHLLRLDTDSRMTRFQGLVSDAHVRRHAENAIRADTVLYGAFIGGELVAVAELHPLRGAFTGAGEAEAAFSVERAYQDIGIGTELFRRLTTAARNRGIRRLVLHCLPGNARMQHICAKFDARVTFADGEARAVMDAAAPTPLSMWVEAVADGTGFAKALLDAELTLLRAA